MRRLPDPPQIWWWPPRFLLDSWWPPCSSGNHRKATTQIWRQPPQTYLAAQCSRHANPTVTMVTARHYQQHRSSCHVDSAVTGAHCKAATQIGDHNPWRPPLFLIFNFFFISNCNLKIAAMSIRQSLARTARPLHRSATTTHGGRLYF
jgi:hypothetical protein